MSKTSSSSPVRGGAPDVDELTRFVIDTARDDIPAPEAKARLLASAALTVPTAPGSLVRGTLMRIPGGRGAYAVGVALVAAGATVFTTFIEDAPRPPAVAASAARLEAPSATATTTPVVGELIDDRSTTVQSSTVETNTPPEPSIAANTAPSSMAKAPSPYEGPRRNIVRPGDSHRSAPSSTENVALASPGPANADSPQDGTPSSTLDREIARMKSVRAELARGDAARALALLDSYDAEFPAGAFAVDVVVLRIEALARAGRVEEARRLGERFLAQHPQSASARRVRLTLGSIAPSNEDSPVSPR